MAGTTHQPDKCHISEDFKPLGLYLYVQTYVQISYTYSASIMYKKKHTAL
jgi:hypothetical protein